MPSVAKKIMASTLWQLSSQVAMAALSILSVKFVATALSLELAGYYNSSYGYLQIFGILADFGLYAVSVREMSRSDRKEEILSALIFLRTIILTLSLGSAILFAWLLPQWRETPLPLGITFAALTPFFSLLSGTLRSVFQINYRLQYVFIAEVSQRILTTTMLGVIILFGIRGSTNESVFLYCTLIGGIGALLLLLLLYVFAHKFVTFHVRWNAHTMRHLLQSALPFGTAYLLLSFCRQFDMTLIALLRDDFQIQNAYYGFALRMGEMGFLIPTFLLNSILPVVSERQERGEDASSLLGKTFLLLLLLGTTAGLFAILWPRPLIALLTTREYLSTIDHPGADTALRLASVPMFLYGFILFSFYMALVHGEWKRLIATLAVSALFSVGSNLLLIPHLGFVGAATTAIIVQSFLVSLLLPATLKYAQPLFPPTAFVRWFVFSLLLAVGLWVSRPFLANDALTFLGLAVAGIALGVLLWITGLVRLLGALQRQSLGLGGKSEI
ncbi:MAG: oligosaccharide flippase family protein [Candidatus Peribacteraceae bacterium]|nr:oligosaccharide flippase family protein [Candidatus Peribacteraceae bacterium]